MWLALDTATDRASVALGDGATLLEDAVEGARRHAGAVLPLVDALLRRAGIAPAALDGVLVSDGPGSFTGLRVGAAVAKALAHAHGIPLWTAPSLLVRAAGVAGDGDRPRRILAVSNALRGELYAGLYRFAGGRIETLRTAAVCRPDELDRLGPADLVVGEAPPPLAGRAAAAGGGVLIAPPEGAPRAAMLLRLRTVAGGAVPVADSGTWEPDYGRPAEAQARWEIAHGRPLPDPAGRPR